MKFIFLSDTHFGANPMGFQQQKGYPEQLKELLGLLENKIKDYGDIDFILHSGDIADSASVENITGAVELFGLSVPVYLCLGNHDVTAENSLDLWRKYGSCFFADGNPDFSIVKDNVFIHVMPTHWETTPFFWATCQDAHFLPEQIERVTKLIDSNPDKIHIICTHSPVLGIPEEQTGFDTKYHYPGDEFSKGITALLEKYPGVKCVLSGHNHVNSHVKENGVHYITASSFSEVPFEFKIIEITDEKISMQTVSLASEVSFKAVYNFDKTLVQGRAKDRMFSGN
ncbi:MAG: hypothetical protein A2Y17_04740 [Clostridiales bacterium GWF2_38_85]|nr:MAG: hypothetical protein A2Y17_04740 [Clostridiales bacterium GWF2_38_85]HBL84405.1 hypothetical protein [Clostridiales bacterium]